MADLAGRSSRGTLPEDRRIGGLALPGFYTLLLAALLSAFAGVSRSEPVKAAGSAQILETGHATAAATSVGGKPVLGLKVAFEETPAGDGVRAAFLLINPEPLSVADIAVRLCLPPGWNWGPMSLPWEEEAAGSSTCRRIQLGTVPGNAERRFTLDFIQWPPLGGGGLLSGAFDADTSHRTASPVSVVPVLDVAVLAGSALGEVVVLRRTHELRPAPPELYPAFARLHPDFHRRSGIVPLETGLPGSGNAEGGFSGSVILAAASEAHSGSAGSHWSVTGGGPWGVVTAELQTHGAWEWEPGLLGSSARGPSSPASSTGRGAGWRTDWTATQGGVRIGSPTNGLELDWRWGPAKEVAFAGLKPTLPATSAWRIGGRASGESPVKSGRVTGRVDVGGAEGDVWMCRLAETAVGWEREGAWIEAVASRVVNTLLSAKGIQRKEAALAAFRTGTLMRLGGRPWSVEGLIARGVPRTLTPSCGLSPKEGWRLQLQVERKEKPGSREGSGSRQRPTTEQEDGGQENEGWSLLERLSWTAAWPLEPRENRPFTHEFAAALAFPFAEGVSVEAEPAIRFASGEEAALAVRTQALVGSLHRFRLELGPEALAPLSDLPRAGEGAGRVAAGWEVRRGPFRPRLAYLTEVLPKGRRHELRGGFTLLGSLGTPWSGGREKVEWSVRLAGERSWGAGGEEYENLFAFRLGRRPSTLRAEWTWSPGKRGVSLTIEHAPGNRRASARRQASFVDRVEIALEHASVDGKERQRFEGAVEGRWALGRWGGALARTGAWTSAWPGGSDGSAGVAVQVFGTWDLDPWELWGEWRESAHAGPTGGMTMTGITMTGMKETMETLGTTGTTGATGEKGGSFRRVVLGVRRRIGAALGLAAAGGVCWHGSGGTVDADGGSPVACAPAIALEWRPPFLGGGTTVVAALELPTGSAGGPRAALVLAVPLSW